MIKVNSISVVDEAFINGIELAMDWGLYISMSDYARYIQLTESEGEKTEMRNFRLNDESGHQEALFNWAEYNMKRMPELEFMHHVPNGGKRDATTAVALKRQGVKAGVPDVCLPAPRGAYHGLYIEFKAGKNTTTAKQKKWLDFLKQQGYYTAVCYNWQVAAELIERYLLHTEDLGKAGLIWGK